MRVLLIEDNANYARVVEYLLRTAQGSGLTFYWADSLAQGIAQLCQVSIDILLLDLSLPDSQGLETLIRLQENAKSIPIIVLTGNNDEQVAIDAMRHGAQDYLVKTAVDRQALTRAIRYAIERKNAEVRLQRQRQRRATLQQEMRDTERKYQELIDNIDAIVWEADPTRSRFAYVSKAAEEKLGFGVQLWLQEDFWNKQIHPDDRLRVSEFFSTANKQGEKRELEYRVFTADGRIMWLRDIIRVAKNNEGQPARLRGVMFDITEAREAEAALQKHSAAILSLQEIGQKVLDAEDDGGAIESILDLVMNLIGHEMGAVRILAPKGNLLPLTMRGSGNLLSICTMGDFCQVGDGVETLFSSMLASKKTEIFKSIQGIPEFAGWKQQGAVSAVVVPIMAQNEALGILAVGSRQMTMLRPNQVHLLETLASQVGFVIQKAVLCEEIRSHLNWIESLREFEKSMVSTLDLDGALNLLLDKIETVFYFPTIVIVQLIDPHSGEFAVIRCRNFDTDQWSKAHSRPFQGGLARAIIEAGAPISIFRLNDDPRVKNHEFNRQEGLISYLGIPLTVQDKTVGVLGIATKREYLFPKHQIDYISSLASHAAIVIQNAYLYTELDKNTQGLSALFDVTSAASHSLEMPRILREVVRKISSIFSFDATKMYLFDDLREVLRIRAAYEVPASSAAEFESIKKGEGIVGQVALSGEPIIIAHIGTDVRYVETIRRGIAQAAGHESLACFPIKFETKVLGAILCFSQRHRELSDDEVRLITSMTMEIAVAVENMQRYEQSKKQSEQLRHLATHLESVREQERTRIAREIHDELGQLLTGLKFDFSWLRGKVMNAEPTVAAGFAAVAETLDVTVQTVRKISTQLRPDVLDKVGLAAAIEWQLQEFRRRTGTRYHFTSKPADIRIDDERSTAIFRIFQEALTNVTRHGQATRVRITLALKTRQISLRVEDNGIGIDAEKLHDPNSLGLLGMRERAASLGGRVTIRKNQKFGTTVLVCLPLEAGGHDEQAIRTREALRSTL